MKAFDNTAFNRLPVVGILRGESPERCLHIAGIYQQAGFSTLEVTMNSPGVADTISALRETFPSLNTGAGTVCSSEELDQALTAGAQFIVTPVMNEQIIRHCVAEGVPVFPGAYTPSEIYRAWAAGATAVKIFPATQLGPRYVKDILAPLNDLKLLPTGGVTADNLAEYVRAGAAGLGMGSGLFPKEILGREQAGRLSAHIAGIRELYFQARAELTAQ